MTIYFPDLSHWDADRGTILEPDTVALIAKATHATSLVDPAYARWKAQAQAIGAVFCAYHWLNHGSLQAQAEWCYQHVGPAVPLMIDAEDVSGNTGFNGTLTVADIVGFTDAYRKLGGVCHLVYLPHWYWERMGGPDLRPLIDDGLSLVSSNYTTYSDDGPGWQPYGGVTPAIWQYTNQLPYGGATSDFNAFKGTTGDLAALMSGQQIGGDMVTSDDGQLVWRVYAIEQLAETFDNHVDNQAEANPLAVAINGLVRDVAAMREAQSSGTGVDKATVQQWVRDAIRAELQGAKVESTIVLSQPL